MEKDRKTRVIAIIALCVAVVGLSIGFAAFTRDLNIQFSESNVNVSGELDIRFLASEDINGEDTIINGEGFNITSEGTSEKNESIIINPAVISSDNTTISGMGGTFNNNDQIFGYEFYFYNNSEYDAYLKSIDFLNYMDTNSNKICTALEGTKQSLVDDACNNIFISVEIDRENVLDLFNGYVETKKILKGEVVSVGIAIMYAGDNFFGLFGETSAILPNGDFKINFGDIKFRFSSLEG